MFHRFGLFQDDAIVTALEERFLGVLVLIDFTDQLLASVLLRDDLERAVCVHAFARLIVRSMGATLAVEMLECLQRLVLLRLHNMLLLHLVRRREHIERSAAAWSGATEVRRDATSRHLALMLLNWPVCSQVSPHRRREVILLLLLLRIHL